VLGVSHTAIVPANMIQVQDRPRHKNPCNNIKAGREKANELEAKLRADGGFDPTKAGHWTMLPVKLYLKARDPAIKMKELHSRASSRPRHRVPFMETRLDLVE